MSSFAIFGLGAYVACAYSMGLHLFRPTLGVLSFLIWTMSPLTVPMALFILLLAH